jgi:hypothetical protein
MFRRMGYMLLGPQNFALLLSLLPFAFHISVPRSVRELFLDALGTGRTLMDDELDIDLAVPAEENHTNGMTQSGPVAEGAAAAA